MPKIEYDCAVRIAKCDEDWGVGDGVVLTTTVVVTVPKVWDMTHWHARMQVQEVVREQISKLLFDGDEPVLEIVAERSK